MRVSVCSMALEVFVCSMIWWFNWIYQTKSLSQVYFMLWASSVHDFSLGTAWRWLWQHTVSYLLHFPTLILLKLQTTLSVVNDGSLHMGDTVQLVNPVAQDRTKYFANIDPRDESCLSVNISATKLLQERRIAGTCQVSSSINHKSPFARNTFVIER